MAVEILFDDEGWALIHRYMETDDKVLTRIHSIEKCLKENPDCLEVETRDSFRRTPLLLAVHYNNKEAVDLLLREGACATVVDNYDHGIVEICSMNENDTMLHHFMDKPIDGFNVWERLVNFVEKSASNEESEKVAKMVYKLTDRSHTQGTDPQPCTQQHWQQLVKADGILALIKKCGSAPTNVVKLHILNTFKNIILKDGVPEATVRAGGVKLFIDLIKSGVKTVINACMPTLQEIAKFSADYAIAVHKAGFLTDAMKLLQNSRLTQETTTCMLETMCHVVSSRNEAKIEIGKAPKIFELLLSIFKKSENMSCIPLVTAAAKAIGSIIEDNVENQNRAVDEGAAGYLLQLARTKHKDWQYTAIKVLYSLSRDNEHTVARIVNDGGVDVILELLRKCRAISLREALSRTAWSLAGSKASKKYTLASAVGAPLLTDFLAAQGEHADNLICIACEGLATLANGSFLMQREAVDDNGAGIIALVRLLRSQNELVKLSALKALRYSCLSVGYIPNSRNQTMVSTSRGLKFLVTFLVYEASEEIKVEAALTIAAAVLGHGDNSAQLEDFSEFNYLHVIRLFYSEKRNVRLSAGNALATFCYNNINLQQEIAKCDGIRWHNFIEFLSSDDDVEAIHAAFQIVVMSRIIPDMEPAESAAEAINVLVRVLQKSNHEDAMALAADCIARLCHTRAGIPSAFVAIDAVKYLFSMLESDSAQVRGSAAIALGYLTFDHVGLRKLLAHCREKPHLVHGIRHYTRMYKLSPSFVEGWKHSMLVSSIEMKSDLMNEYNVESMQRLLCKPNLPETPLTSLNEETGRQDSTQMHRLRNQIIGKDDSSQVFVRSSDSSRITRNSALSPTRSPYRPPTDNPASVLSDGTL